MTPLKRKLENVIVAYLKPHFANTPNAPLPIIAGKITDLKTLPCIIVYSEGETPNPELPPDCGVSDIDLRVLVLTQADDETLSDHDERLERVHELLSNSEQLEYALNTRHPDNRAIKNFHLYDLILQSVDEGMDDRHFGDILRYKAVCQDVDGVL